MISGTGAELLDAGNYDACDNSLTLLEFWLTPELRPHPLSDRQVRRLLLTWLLDGIKAVKDTMCIDAIRALDDDPQCNIDAISREMRSTIGQISVRAWKTRYPRIPAEQGRYRQLLAAVDALVQPEPLAEEVWAGPIVSMTMAAPDDHWPGLVQDLLPNPFRPVLFDPAWSTSTVAALAAGIYADRAWDRMPVLADALEEAGCNEPRILDHCRTYPVHTRGCWVVDAILGK